MKKLATILSLLVIILGFISCISHKGIHLVNLSTEELASETELILTTSDPVRYSHTKLDDPPCIIINFLEDKVFSIEEDELLINKGAIKKIKNEYFESSGNSPRHLNLMIVELTHDSPYKIANSGSSIIILIENPVKSQSKASKEKTKVDLPLQVDDKVPSTPFGYIIGPGDLLYIEVWKQEDISRQVTVNYKGEIKLPPIKTVSVIGLNAPQLEEKLTKALSKYLIDPIVFVTVREYNSQRVIALGETKTGMYTLKRKTTLVEFLGQIGGPNDDADTVHIRLIKKDGKKLLFNLGENEDDPIFSVPDLLPHLSHEVQDTKKMDDAIKGESLDIMIGSIPEKGDAKEKIKTTILNRLHKDYGIVEEDFISAELEAVPVYKARDIGFDRSLIGGYGQDDKVCTYASLKAVMDLEKPEHTAIALFVDKEEIGSEGNASAQVTTFIRSIIKDLDPKTDVDSVMLKSKVLSADVNAAVTPNYTEVFELKNASTLGNGVVMSKFTGHGGKYSANDASAEYVAEIRNMLNREKIPWQTAELGKVDKGGGGTVAKYFSKLGMEVIDLGPAVMSMHAPFEVTSKVDIYSSYLAYKAFLKS